MEATDLTICDGEFLTLLGPSGSGKTTLLMMMAGLTEPSLGSIHLDGADITDTPAYKRDIGVVFQNYALFPHMTVFENVAFPLRMRRVGEGKIRQAVGRALDLVRLGHLGSRYPRELSGGQQQRVAFARAIVFKPAVVLMDEPLGALDKKLREELKIEIRNLHRNLGVTIIYVTHDQEEAMLLSDRICLMNNAKIEQTGTPMGLYQRPLTRFAADFIGESNILRVRPDGSHSISFAGHSIRLSDPIPAGSGELEVLVRPERIRLTPPNEGQLVAKVTSIIELGSVRRITVTLPNGADMRVTTLGGEEESGALGEDVGLHIEPSDMVPLRAGPAQ